MKCDLDNITIHYESFGEGTPLLFLHGWTLDHRYEASAFEPVFKRRSGWHRIYINLPGHGQTPGVEWITNQDQMLDVLLEFIEQIIPGQRFILIGTSIGAYLARGVVYRKADFVDGLLLRIPLIVADEARRSLPSQVILVEDRQLISSLSPEEAELYQDNIVQKPSYFNNLRKIMEEDIIPAQQLNDESFLNKIRMNPKNYSFSFDVDSLPEPFEAPTLIITGRQDTSVGYRDAWEILENYPRATFVVLDRAGHGIPVEQVDLFDALVDEWLDRVEEYVD